MARSDRVIPPRARVWRPLPSRVPFALAEFIALRPCLYHVTARSNVEEIGRRRVIDSVAAIAEAAGVEHLIRTPRRQSHTVTLGGRSVVVRDQKPLHERNIAFEGGWMMADLLEALAERVFFWPGRRDGPIRHGRNHVKRYQREGAAMLRIDTASLFEAAGDAQPQFCRFNSGSPRCSPGRHSPRGPGTFVAADEADFCPSQVVEVTFRRRAILPPHRVEWRAADPTSLWQPL